MPVRAGGECEAELLMRPEILICDNTVDTNAEKQRGRLFVRNASTQKSRLSVSNASMQRGRLSVGNAQMQKSRLPVRNVDK